MGDPEFGVNVSNRFAFLDEEASAPEAAPKKEEKKKEVKPKTETRKDSKPRERSDSTNKGERAERAPRGEGGRGRGRGGARGRGGGRGRGRGGGGSGEPREFDRHVSGTGRRDVERREGRGKYNWGGEGETDRPRRNRRPQGENGEEATEEAPVDVDAPAEEAVEVEPEVEAEPEPYVEPEPETRSYEEYLEAQKNAALEEDNLVIRTVKNDDFQGQKAQAFAKDEIDEGPVYEFGTASKKGKGKKTKKESKILSIDQFKAQEAAAQSFRGNGRGRGRGGRGRGGRGAPLRMDDSNFPKLG